MYGTIAKLTVKPDTLVELMALSAGWPKAPGEIASYVLRLDNNPEELMIVAVFESREAYWANAESKEQHARYLEMRALLASDPEWHDGEIIDAHYG